MRQTNDQRHDSASEDTLWLGSSVFAACKKPMQISLQTNEYWSCYTKWAQQTLAAYVAMDADQVADRSDLIQSHL